MHPRRPLAGGAAISLLEFETGAAGAPAWRRQPGAWAGSSPSFSHPTPSVCCSRQVGQPSFPPGSLPGCAACCKHLCLFTPPLEPCAGSPWRQGHRWSPSAQLLRQGPREQGNLHWEGLGDNGGAACQVCSVRDVGEPRRPSLRPAPPLPLRAPREGSAIRSPAPSARNFSAARPYLLLVGVADFATRGQELSCTVFCVLNLIVALLFSLKKISKNC